MALTIPSFLLSTLQYSGAGEAALHSLMLRDVARVFCTSPDANELRMWGLRSTHRLGILSAPRMLVRRQFSWEEPLSLPWSSAFQCSSDERQGLPSETKAHAHRAVLQGKMSWKLRQGAQRSVWTRNCGHNANLGPSEALSLAQVRSGLQSRWKGSRRGAIHLQHHKERGGQAQAAFCCCESEQFPQHRCICRRGNLPLPSSAMQSCSCQQMAGKHFSTRGLLRTRSELLPS